MAENIDGFIKKSDVEDRIINKYKGKVPQEIIDFWEKYGFGSFLGGYLKSVNPEVFEEVLKEGSQRFQDGIVLFATGMGDLIIWSNNYVRVLNYRYGRIDTIMAGFDFFFDDLNDIGFREKDLKWAPYEEAVNLLGTTEYDECFGYVPLLGLGGSEKVENLEKVKLIEHILIIINFMGPIA